MGSGRGRYQERPGRGPRGARRQTGYTFAPDVEFKALLEIVSMKNYRLLKMLGRDVWIVSRHLEQLELAGAEIIEKERELIREPYDPNDPGQSEACEHDLDMLDEGNVTRLLTGSAILAIWALYETAVQKCAVILQQTKKEKLKMSDIKGRGVLGTAEKYYSAVLQTPLHAASVDMSRLRTIATIRHVFAHANGELEYMKENLQKEILDLADKNDQVNIFPDFQAAITSGEDPDKYSDWVIKNLKNQPNITTGSLVVTQEYVSACWEFIRPLIEELIERTKASYVAMDDTSE